jgi:tetrapyrrole methylase family protein/MazG family protein
MIYLVGLGPAGEESLSVAARHRLLSGSPIILRTERHPTVDFLRQAGVSWQSCDDLYNALDDFDAVYEAIAERVLQAALSSGSVIYAVPGHPLIGEATVRRILDRARDSGVEAEIVGAMSFIEPVLTAAGVALDEALVVADALSVDAIPLPPEVPLLLYQIYDRDTASRVKLALLKDRPDHLEVVAVRWAGMPASEEVLRVPLHRIDRVHADHLTAVYVPAVPPEQRRKTFADLKEVMRRLRAKDGCPWDREQTHESLRKWLIEESYEAVDAVDRGDLDDLCEELGDVLLQIVFHAQIASESGLFDADDVVEGIVEKLIRRHPHVFADAHVADARAVETNWEAIKKTEKTERKSVLDGVPASLPALQRATELGRRAAAVGFDWERTEDVMAKVEEELEEVRQSLQSGDPAEITHEIGDLLFAVTNLARWADVDPEDALRRMLGRFEARFHRIEDEARASHRDLRSMTLEEMDAVWNRAKSEVQ